jgi:hypothetical protein
MAARVVDLPLPVGPVTSTRPRGFSVRLSTDRGQPELVQTLYLLRDGPEGRPERAPLEVDVDPEARGTREGVGEVQLPVVLQTLALVAREDIVDQLARGVGGKGLVVERPHLALHTDHRRQVNRHVEVTRLLPHGIEQVIV